MGIIYFSTMFEKNDLNGLIKTGGRVSFAANKFNRLLCEGFAANGVATTAYPLLPVTKGNSDRLWIGSREFVSDHLRVHYPPTLNISGLKQFFRLVDSFFRVLFAPKNTAVVYDVFAISSAVGATVAARIRRFQRLCIVTDLPEMIVHRRMSLAIHHWALRHADGYILLTEQMREKADPSGKKPAVVIEGVCALNPEPPVSPEEPCRKKIVMYTGSLNVLYGIRDLVDAFLSCHKEDEELHLYGDGDYVPELRKIVDRERCIRYFGSVPNDVVVQAQRKAALLVNPRTCEGEYTQYSFPSKIMEYMNSGTPVLMAVLPGIGKEYFRYCYTFDDKDPDGLRIGLRKALDADAAERSDLGKKAQVFVSTKKNKVCQAAKIIDTFSLG